MKFSKLLLSLLLIFAAGCASVKGQNYYDSGKEKYITGDFEVAIANFTKAIEIDPNNHLAFLKRGTVYSWQENYPAAIKDFKKAIEVPINIKQTATML
jgi:tetratricopeptide (TPR) repeat protein